MEAVESEYEDADVSLKSSCKDADACLNILSDIECDIAVTRALSDLEQHCIKTTKGGSQTNE